MNGSGGTALALHFLNDGNIAPDVFDAVGRPLVRQLGHGRGWRDRIYRAHLVHAISHMRDGGITVHSCGLLAHFSAYLPARGSFQWHDRDTARSTPHSRYISHSQSDIA